MMIRQQRTRVQAPALPQSGIPSSSSSMDAPMKGNTQTPSGGGVTPMKKTRNPDLPDLRNRLRIATWNVLTMSDSGYQTALVRELARHHIPIAGITEARIPGSDCRRVDDAILLHSGGSQCINGVALIIGPPFTKSLQSYQAISDRLLCARLSHRHGHLTVIVAYAPTEIAMDSEKDTFYDQLSSVVQSVPPHDNLVILGDLNAVSGPQDNFNVVGPFGSGIPNDNSDRLTSFCGMNGLTILGSWFQRSNIHRWTWISRDGSTKKELDHVLTRQRDKGQFKRYRVYRGPESPANSDHLLVATDLTIQLSYPKKTDNVRRPYDTSRLLQDSLLQQSYSIAVQNKFDCLSDTVNNNVDDSWESLRNAIQEAADEIIGPRKNIRQSWLSADTFNLIELKSAARIRNDHAERKRLQGVFKARAKVDHNTYLSTIADEVEDDLLHNRMRSAFSAIKTLSGHQHTTSPCTLIHKADDSPCNSEDEVLARWAEHFTTALNHPPGTVDTSLDSESASAAPSLDARVDEPTLDEVVRAIKKLRNGRASGPDGIPPELLKCALGPVSRALHSLFLQVWRSGRVPSDWRDGIIISLYKGKGPKTKCSNYRPITLLSVPGKVFAHVLLSRIQPLLEPARRPQQSGFTAGRSTVDAILALRLLSELHREFDRPLNVAYLDIKAAFDSVDRIALWKALRSKGIPDILVQLIEALHQSTGARVRIGSRLSSRFQTTSGVRQGCILAPMLFCVAIDWILEHMSFCPGINIGNSNITDLVYADDTALLLPSVDDAAPCLSSFSTAAAPLGLKISWEKTKLQNLGSGPQPTSILVDSNQVDSVDSFVYLGCLQSSSGQCRPDLKRRIGFASSTMSSLSRIWKDKRLTTATKVRLYQVLVMSVLLYAAETWTLLAADLRTLEAFHMRCQRQILGIRWTDHIRNATVSSYTGLASVGEHLASRRIAIFGHTARLGEEVPAHQALRAHVDLSLGRPPGRDWQRRPGRPSNRWVDQIRNDTGNIPSTLWRSAILRGHGTGVTQRPSPATRT